MNRMKIPWMSRICDGWTTQPVRFLFQIGRGRVISNENIHENQGNYPVYSSQTENNGILGYIDTFDFSGDYLTWTTDGAKAGTIFRRKGNFNCTNVCGTLKLLHKETNLGFFGYALSIATQFYVRQDINPKLMNDVMSRILLPVPPKKIQKQIADFLDQETARIDQLIDKKKVLISVIETLYASKINEALNRFETRKLKTIAKIQISNVDKHVFENEIPVNVIHYTTVYYNDVITKNIDLPTGSVTALEKSKFALYSGNILITKDSETADDIAIPTYISSIKENTVCGYHIAIIRPNIDLVDGRFIFWGLKTKKIREYFLLSAQGVTRFGLSIGKISDCPIPYVGDLNIQDRISETLFKQNEEKILLIKKLENSIEKFKGLKISLITQAVTGQLDIQKWKTRGNTDRCLDQIERQMENKGENT